MTLKSTIATPFSHSCIPLDLSEEPYYGMFSLLVGLLASVCITESPLDLSGTPGLVWMKLVNE